MDIIILAPDKKIYEGQAESVVVPGTEGEFQVLTNHAPIVSSLGSGTVVITNAQRETTNIPISSGFIEVLNNKVSILATQGIVHTDND